MEVLIIILAMASAAAFTIALITLNKYNSYHVKLNDMTDTIKIINKAYEDTAKELELARQAAQLLTDNANAQAEVIMGLQTNVNGLMLAKNMTQTTNRFQTARQNG